MTNSSPVARGGARPGDNVGRAILLVVVAILSFGLQDACTKTLVQTYSPFQVTMLRYWAFAAFALYLVSRQAPLRQALRSRAPLMQVTRGTLLMVNIWLCSYAFRTVPLAEFQAIIMLAPLLVTLFAVPILGEQVGIFRMVTVSVGFLGALVILRPGGLPLDGGALFVLMGSGLYALYLTLTRKVASHDSATTSIVYVALTGAVLGTGVGLFFLQPMDLAGMALLAVVMATTCIGHSLMTLALSMAPASTLQPFNYLSLPWGITLGFLVFGDMIDPISLLGAGIIVGAGLVVIARERHKARQRPAAPTQAAPAE